MLLFAQLPIDGDGGNVALGDRHRNGLHADGSVASDIEAWDFGALSRFSACGSIRSEFAAQLSNEW